MTKVCAYIKIKGIVQGVGFRPFVHRLVCELGLSGNVRNTSFGASLIAEGEKEKVLSLIKAISKTPPPLAFIEKVEARFSEKLCGFEGFRIVESEKGEKRRTLISPDVATCPDCIRELYDKDNARYRYPFINCTNCGPRFTIIQDIPYDRENTTMAGFSMCKPCLEEYGNIEDRRYHAEPTCCPDCGPRLFYLDEKGKEAGGDAVKNAREKIISGGIVAIKGLGGVHIACKTDDAAVIKRLRERKRRDEKPFAIMCRDVSAAREFANISPDEERLLSSLRRPIVLLEKKDRTKHVHISENGYIGIMLPYTPVHHMLFEEELSSVVMTSANLSDLPIVYKNSDVLTQLSGVCDGFLLNNRDIHTRCDDSLVWSWRGNEYFARRSRGYVPHPLGASKELPAILSCGAEQKASFCISRETHVFPSQHIGDLKNLETLENYEEQICRFERMFDIKPEILACDMHPDYLSTEYATGRAKREGLSLIKVQHHHAHMAACMADNDTADECIGIIWDGTGYGTDGKIWGAEFLTGGFGGFQRVGTILPIKLPGGDRAAKEIYRIGQSLLFSAKGSCDEEVERLLRAGLNCPEATSMGRLFDGVSAILGIKSFASYEGQGAVMLEAVAEKNCDGAYPYEIKNENGLFVFDWREMIRSILSDKEKGESIAGISACFMNTLVSFATDMAEKISANCGLSAVALSGGTFQNMYILKKLSESLEKKGFRVLTHRRVSTNDEGLSLGQLFVAAEKIKGDRE